MTSSSPLNFANRDLRNRSFKGQNLNGANFSGSDIRGCDFSYALLQGANFERVRAGQTPKQFIILVLRSEEHTSELQSRQYLVCRLLLEKKKRDQFSLQANNT